MSARKFRCNNLADQCPKAVARELLEVAEGDEPLCPECKYTLAPVQERRGTPKHALLAASVAAAAAGLGLSGYLLYAGKITLPRTAVRSYSSLPPVPMAKGEVAAAYPCGLKPTSAPDVARLLLYLKQGMYYASQKKPELAMHEFEQVLKIDPNFLGAQMNIGSAELVQKNYARAEAAFERELKLIDCLKQMNDDQLASFAYMGEVGSQPSGSTHKMQAGSFHAHLQKAEADVHYNLACVNSRQQQKDHAIGELAKALAGGLIDAKSLQTDPDLQAIRGSAEFKALIAGYNPAPVRSP